MLRSSTAMVAALCVLSGCATSPDPETEKVRRAWSQVVRDTRLVELGDGRVRVEASTPFAQDLSVLEYTALARAAGAARAAGVERFGIVYADYDAGPLSGLLSPSIELGGAGWIGTYEDLLDARDRNDLGGELNDRFGYRTLTVVVRLLNDEDEAGRAAFSSAETYDAMLRERIDRKRIEPKRRLKLPGLPF